MKYLIVLLLILIANIAIAGTLTINTTAPQDARIVAAFGKQLNTMDLTDPENPVPRDATGAEVRRNVIKYIKQIVHAQERKAGRKVSDNSILPLDIDPN